MRDTLAFVVEHLANTSNFKAGPDEEGRDPEACCPFVAAIPAASTLEKERILSMSCLYDRCAFQPALACSRSWKASG
jgi:hypothetical protein